MNDGTKQAAGRTSRLELEEEVRILAQRPRTVRIEMPDGAEERVTVRAIAYQDALESAKVIGEVVRTYYRMAITLQTGALDLFRFAEAARSAESGEPGGGDAAGEAASAARDIFDGIINVELIDRLLRDCDGLVAFLVEHGSDADMDRVRTWDWFVVVRLATEVFKTQVGVRLRDFLSGDFADLKPLFAEENPSTSPNPSSSGPGTPPAESGPGASANSSAGPTP